MSGLRVLFLVNGEGRGHLAQALALQELLDEAGHTLIAVRAGAAEAGVTLDLFAHDFHVPLETFAALRMVPDAAHRRITEYRTLGRNLLRIPIYVGSVRAQRRAIAALRPDVVVTFWEHLSGLALRLGLPSGTRALTVSSLHYLYGHAQVPPPPGGPIERALFRMLNRFAGPPGVPRVALSLRPLEDPPGWTTRVLPPLLRRVVQEARPTAGDHLLVYLLHHGQIDELARWHASRPDVRLHVFWDRPGAPETLELRPGMICHRPSAPLFLELLRGCRGLVTSAGFQAVAEAMWLGKPVMVVPTEGHIEQRWNAREAVAAGAGIASDRFDLGPFLDYLPRHRQDTAAFRAWVTRGRDEWVRVLEGRAD